MTTDALAALAADGQLEARFPEAVRLVGGLQGRDLARAGQLLSGLDPARVHREHPGVPVLTVAVTGHGTVAPLIAPLIAPLAARLAGRGVALDPYLAPFDSYVVELADPGSALYAADPDLVVCVLDPCVVFDEAPTPWQPSDIERIAAEKAALIEGLAARFAELGRGVLALNTLPLPRRFSAQLVDHRSRARLSAIWRELGNRLLAVAEKHSSVVVVDLEPLIAEGVAAFDPRLSLYAKAHLSADLFAAYAHELTGRTRKALVLDLDNTVWGGILGDDGIDGIEVAGSHRGEAFRAFQKVARQLGSQGVLLAAVSKNELEPVQAALREHPDMVLREADFVRVIADWRPKNESLKELAQALNLGVDSLVFADDSAYECGLVRTMLPEVAVAHLDGDPAGHVAKLLRDGWFDTRVLTAEDRGRVGKYRQELERQDFLAGFESIEEYLRELRVEVQLSDAGPAAWDRVAQLTQRTNQFHLTTRRLQPDEVRAMAEDPGRSVLCVRSADRFGDNGLVGALFLRQDADTVHIDNFLLSCRVFARGIEQACLAAVLRRAKASGASQVVGHYAPTAKNGIVAQLYPRSGFELVQVGAGNGGADRGTSSFRHGLESPEQPPAHVEMTEDWEMRAL